MRFPRKMCVVMVEFGVCECVLMNRAREGSAPVLADSAIEEGNEMVHGLGFLIGPCLEGFGPILFCCWAGFNLEENGSWAGGLRRLHWALIDHGFMGLSEENKKAA
ncbi:hypothetical protein Droror1_Dr00009779 [Drosera rotundifolia]